MGKPPGTIVYGPVNLKYDRCFMCAEPPEIRGYCMRHYRQMLKGCTENGHRRKVKVRGYWRGDVYVPPHYQSRLVRGRPQLVPYVRPPKPQCSTQGCDRIARQLGLCGRCWWKQYRKRPEVIAREAEYRESRLEKKRAYARERYRKSRMADAEAKADAASPPYDAPALVSSGTGAGT